MVLKAETVKPFNLQLRVHLMVMGKEAVDVTPTDFFFSPSIRIVLVCLVSLYKA